VSSPPGRAAGVSPVAMTLVTGTASPVSRDSSTCSPAARDQHRVGRHPVALGEHHQIVADHLTPGDALGRTIA
jgi:hypothetical protein